MIFRQCYSLKKYAFFILSWWSISCLPIVPVIAQTNSSGLEISLLTCESGNALYSTFGHTAIRIIDHSQQKDLVFDFGNFDFDTPFFMLKFLRGSLDYHLSVTHFTHFQKSYQRAKRGVIEQSLNLDTVAKQKIYQQLLINLQPANRAYKYDFLKDNCTTRVRDIINQNATIQVQTSTEKTHRTYLKGYLKTKEWLAFGIDILLGSRIDRQLIPNETVFLPNGLSAALTDYRLINTGISLLGA